MRLALVRVSAWIAQKVRTAIKHAHAASVSTCLAWETTRAPVSALSATTAPCAQSTLLSSLAQLADTAIKQVS